MTGPTPPRRRCLNCGSEDLRFAGSQSRATCGGCGSQIGFMPRVEASPDAAASPDAVLDVLLLAEDEGVALRSDGRVAAFATAADGQRASARLRRLLQQCRHRLGP